MRVRSALSVSALLMIAACKKGGGGELSKPPPAPPVKVPLAAAELQPTPKQLVLTGIIAADQRAEVTADTQGKVLNVMVDRGKRVKLGDPLVQLDVRSAALGAREAQANLASARAQRALAQEECKRTQELFDKQAIPRSEYDRQMTQCTAALQQVSAAEARAAMMSKSIADGIVRAPFDGMIGERMVTPGEWVAPGRPLFVLVDDDPLKIELSVPEAAVRAIREGQPVTLTAVAVPGETFTATVTRIGAEIGRSRALIVEATLDARTPAKPPADAAPARRELVPGMFAEAHVDIGQVDRVVVPRTAVTRTCPAVDGKQLAEDDPACRATWHAFVAVKGELEDRVVQLGPVLATGQVAILQGIDKGERVVTKIDKKIVVDGLRVVE